MNLKGILKKLKPDNLDVLIDVELNENDLVSKIIKSKSKKDFNYAILDDSIDVPYVVNEKIEKLAKYITENSKGLEQKAKDIFDWIDNHINYKEKRNKYRNSAEVLKDMAGVCGSESFLYIVLARLNGLEAKSVHVIKDFNGKRVNHGCAVVILPKRKIFVDPAYHIFDVHHKKVEILSDAKMVEIYKEWR